MSEIVNAFLLVFAALFPIVNPLGSAPIFLSLTADRTPQQRTRLARGVAVNGFFLLLGSLLFGSEILEFFGITVPVVRVAGGLIVAAMGWKLLNEGGEPPEREAVHRTRNSRAHIEGQLLSLDLAADGRDRARFRWRSPSARTVPPARRRCTPPCWALAAIAGLFAIAVTIYVCPIGSRRHWRCFLGQAGVNVLVRLSAFILTCIGIQNRMERHQRTPGHARPLGRFSRVGNSLHRENVGTRKTGGPWPPVVWSTCEGARARSENVGPLFGIMRD